MPPVFEPTYRCISLGMEPIKVPSGMNLSEGANRMLLSSEQFNSVLVNKKLDDKYLHCHQVW